ncbi:unnamed protein product [Mytilus coruscus]|uniref:DDE Tnp4 domain-containing protein n=1 Tax=Mytilus coruscus TaxID=42192 RepID=A0A6J8EZ98_MYTCO|nr:unnamed protein product [Mytilus coruscus]
MHKHRPLVKPMVFITTTSYIISVIGPYFSDGKNNDAQIMKHIIQHDIEEFKEWVTEDDILIVDRGFRDTIDLLQEMGIHTKMPAFNKKGESQLPVEDSNVTRLITKIRLVVESVNGRIKLWKYHDRVLPNSQIPYVSDYVNIAYAIMNKYWPELNTGESQLPVEDSNVTRLITKIRLVVESVNGRIKLWKYHDRVLPNSQIPYVSDYVNIAYAIMNKYWPELNTGDLEKDEQLASKMLYLSKQRTYSMRK